MKYNHDRHVELLQRSKELSNQGKTLYIENREESLELLEYDNAVEKHFFWLDRKKLALLIKNFLDKRSDIEVFCDGVHGFRNILLNKYNEFRLELISNPEKSKDFQPDEKGKKLTGLLTGLFCECEDFGDYGYEDYEEEEFYNTIEKGFLNFQEALNEE